MKGAWLRILCLFIFIALIAVGGGWWIMRGQMEGAPPPPPPANNTNSSPASSNKVAQTSIRTNEVLTLPGVIEPFEAVPVSANLTANIGRLLVRDGSTVQAGQMICSLDDIDIHKQIDAAQLVYLQAQETLSNARQRRATDSGTKRLALLRAQQELDNYRGESKLQLQKAQATLSRAQQTLADSEALYQAKAVSADEVRTKREAVEDAQAALALTQSSINAGIELRQKTLEQTKLEGKIEAVSAQDIQAYQLALANAQQELAERRRRLADVRVMAPISGTVRIIPRTRTSAAAPTGQSAEVLGPGVKVYDGDPFLEIATTEQACIRIDVDETDIGRLWAGMPAKISGDAFSGKELTGEIATIQTSGKKAGEGVSLFPVTVKITSPLAGVRMGMTADVSIDLTTKQSQ